MDGHFSTIVMQIKRRRQLVRKIDGNNIEAVAVLQQKTDLAEFKGSDAYIEIETLEVPVDQAQGKQVIYAN